MSPSSGTDTNNLNVLSIFSVIVLGVGLMNHVMVIPPLLQIAKRDAWLSVLSTIPPYMIWATLLYLIMKRTNQQPLLPWLRHHYGGFVCGLFRCFFIGYLFLISVMTVKETVMWTDSSYLPSTPPIVEAAAILGLCCSAAFAGIRAIAFSSGFLLPFVIVFGDFVMSANLPKKNYSLLTPILENGMLPMVHGCLYIGGGLVELIMLLLIQQHLRTNVKPWSIWLLALFLVFLVLGPVTGAIAEFGPFEAADLRYPAYEEWRLVSIGKYIRHVDFLSIYQWLTGAFARIALSLFLLTELMTPSSKKKIRTAWLIMLGVVILILVVLPVSDMQYLAFLKNYYLPGSLGITTLVLATLFLITLRSKKRTGENL
ncbi:spore germination protein (amino acid permease) [Paenibacillus sp. UNC496MF]|uniref:GerAB/ArcD/ProY family transporter n=1 Tax=Paenibacillus sp. UNC496MF TaxID=1502753 RepID=UPI0008E40A3B|nr:endospore germination permease [Paenibacillus sp. UNC496MF]SFJ76589.1 spore germination protein (amino acid permease) [Paenibacillus sp. UNC496MF]